MNFSAYDKISNKLNKSATWYSKGVLISREITYRKYYCYLKRFNKDRGVECFLALFDTHPNDRQVFRTKRDDFGRLKFIISPIIKDLDIEFKDDRNVTIKLEDEQEDGEIYLIDIEE